MGTKKQQSLPNGRRYSTQEREQAVRHVRTLRDELGTSHGMRFPTRSGHGGYAGLRT